MAKDTSKPLIADSQADGSVPINAEPDINIGAVSTYKIESLKEGNWIAWRSCMITILQFHHAFRHIEGTVSNQPSLLLKKLNGNKVIY